MAASKRTTTPLDFRTKEFAAETEPKITSEEPEAIEEFLRKNGPCRRISTVCLSRTWRQTMKNVTEDREFAVAAGVVFLALEESRAQYFTLAALMESAYERLRAALHERADVEAILAEAAKHEALH